jgi:AcrR family transcriptional regulator
MMVTRVPYEAQGRVRQKTRTRAAMVEAARAWLAEGITPTVEQAADRAGVSRTTSYRYFPNQRSLLVATYPALGETSLLGADAPTDPLDRLELVAAQICSQVIEHEHELRANLMLSLQTTDPMPLRQGRAIRWIEDALSTAGLPKPALRRLVFAIRATMGIEAFVWLTDIAGLSRRDAAALMRSSARTLASAAIPAAPRRGAPRAAPARRSSRRGGSARTS